LPRHLFPVVLGFLVAQVRALHLRWLAFMILSVTSCSLQ
jgi:hypothetical protein